MTDYSKLSDFEINCEVLAVFNPDIKHMSLSGDNSCFYDCGPTGDGWNQIDIPDYCNNPADAWPIIVKSKISVIWMTAEKEWCAWSHGDLEEGAWHWENVPDYYYCCESQLRAAMVCFLMAQESNHANS